MSAFQKLNLALKTESITSDALDLFDKSNEVRITVNIGHVHKAERKTFNIAMVNGRACIEAVGGAVYTFETNEDFFGSLQNLLDDFYEETKKQQRDAYTQLGEEIN
jgi:hypothetical protein